MAVAKTWHLTPDQWDALPEEARAEMLAFESTQSDMRAYEAYLQERREIARKAERSVKGKH